VSYRIGITNTVAAILGVEPTDPCIVCDGCGLKRTVCSKRGGAPAAWFIERKPAPGWALVTGENSRRDYCPTCKRAQKAGGGP
jgi:hypothetical protein